MVATITAALVVTVATVPARADVATAERSVLTASSAVTIAGRGYGHGIGMSQYGARGAALAGQKYPAILNFYYPGTAASTIASGTIRVQVTADTNNDLRVISNGTMTAQGTGAAVALKFGDGAKATQWRVVRNGARMSIYGLVNGSWRAWSTAAGSPLTIRSSAGTVRVVLPNGTSREYHGAARAVPYGAHPGLRTVNLAPFENYLRSVVPAEMPSSWPAEALKAQAVAARTYAARDRSVHGSAAWDTCDSTACQVYSGYRTYAANGALTRTNEAASTTAAITATAGQVRTYKGALAFTQFSSSNGGWTARGSQPYLVAKADPWDATGNPNHKWSVKVSKAKLSAAYPSVGTVTSIRIASRGGNGEFGGRVVTVAIAGTKGSTTTTGSAFRSALGLKSNWWKITGTPTSVGGDFTSNGRNDLIARRTDGELFAYEGNGAGGFSSGGRKIGTGWQGMRVVARAGDLNGDGNPDLVAIDKAGSLWLYASNGAGGFAARKQIGSQWGAMTRIVGAGDLNGDGNADLLAVRSDGTLWFFAGNGASGLASAVKVGNGGWSALTAVLAVGDWTGDGRADIVIRRADGTLWLYPGNGSGGVGTGRKAGTGWQGFTKLVANDWNGDGIADILGTTSAGALRLYPWSGSAFGAAKNIGTGWSTHNLLL